MIQVKSLRRGFKLPQYLDRNETDYLAFVNPEDVFPKNFDITYDLATKEYTDKTLIPIWLKPWKKRNLPKGFYSLKQVEDFINNRFGDEKGGSSWEFVKQHHKKSGDIFTFRYIPPPDSKAGRYSDRYPEEYVHLRVGSKINYRK